MASHIFILFNQQIHPISNVRYVGCLVFLLSQLIRSVTVFVPIVENTRLLVSTPLAATLVSQYFLDHKRALNSSLVDVPVCAH